jgi:ABC-type bacteriocin/lantibiotic exporter with double-glycine peptidase domain
MARAHVDSWHEADCRHHQTASCRWQSIKAERKLAIAEQLINIFGAAAPHLLAVIIDTILFQAKVDDVIA